MSTYWHYECQDHSPKIESDDGINHGEKALEELLSIFKQIPTGLREWPIEISVIVHGSKSPFWFLTEHPNCRVMIKSEYGDYFINGEIFKKESLPS